MTAHIIVTNTSIAYDQRQKRLPPPPRDLHPAVPFSHYTGLARITELRIWMFHPHIPPPFMRHIHPKMKNQDTHNVILYNFY